MVGVALVLVRHGVIEPPRARLSVSSDVPQSVGVSSSAALEIATARALGVDGIDPIRLASICQEAENHVVGAPCGIMDQVVVAMGRAGAVLPILCRPASVRPPMPLPDGIEVVGRPTGAEHDVERRALPPGPRRRVHGQAHRRGSQRSHVAVGERAARRCSRRTSGSARRRGVPRPLGRDRRRRHHRRSHRDVPRRGGDAIRRRGAPAE